MARTLALAAFLVAITCVVADSNDTSAILSPSPSPMATSSAMASSSPVVVVTTSAIPPQPVDPDMNWVLKDAQGDACIRMTAGITINVTFDAKHDNKTKKDFKFYEVSKNAAVYTSAMKLNLPYVSSCDVNTTLLTLVWNNSDTDYYLLTFQFRMNDSSKWELYKTEVRFNTTKNADFVNYTMSDKYPSIDAVVNSRLALAKTNQSYMCNKEEEFKPAADTGKTLEVMMSLKDLKVQAYSFSNSSEFDKSTECDRDKHHGHSGNNKIVPIAVGAALAGLVIIVLIAYLIGRFRSRKSSSYEPLS